MPRRLWAAIVLAVSLASPGRYTQAQTTVATAAPTTLRDLGGVAELSALFDNDLDKIRILLLLSPT